MVLQPSVFLAWDSSICLRCSLRQLRRLHVAAKPRVRLSRSSVPNALNEHSPSVQTQESPLLLQGRDDRGQRYTHNLDSSKAHETRDDDSLLHQSLPSPLNIRLDIRSRLRKWHTEKNAPPLRSPNDNLHKGPLLNYLTRPEDLLNERLETTSSDVENLEDAEEEPEILSNFQGADSFGSGLARAIGLTQKQAPAVTSQPARLNRGDLVELTSYSSYASFICVYLGAEDSGYFQFYSINGTFEFRDSTAGTLAFQVSRFVAPETLEALQSYLPRGGVGREKILEAGASIPSTVAAPLLDKLTKFRDDADEAYRALAPTLAKAHTLLARPLDVEYMTLQEIAQAICKCGDVSVDPNSPHVLFAISQALMKQVFGFFRMCADTYSYDRYVGILPQRIAHSVERVQQCVRAYQEESALLAGDFEVPESISSSAICMRDFVHKSNRLAQESRELRRATPQGQPLSCEPPGKADQSKSWEDVQSLRFTDSDRDFIRVLALSSLSKVLRYHPILALLSNLVLRAAGVYTEAEIHPYAPNIFLIDIGVLDPFSFSQSYDVHVWSTSHRLDNDLNTILTRIEESGSVETAGDLQDSMEGFRKDWGNTPVFCIDSTSTTEVDDGISLEPVHGSPDHVWIHVHIAHLSAYTSPDHVLGRAARHYFATVYAPNIRTPMIPSWASTAFSLSPGKPVLTFSAMLDADSNVLETKIQPGRIHNTLRISPEELNKEVFGLHPVEPEFKSFQVGRKPENLESPPIGKSSLSDECKGALRTLYSFCNRFVSPSMSLDVLKPLKRRSIRASHPRGTSMVSVFDLAPLRAKFSTEDPHVEVTEENEETPRTAPSQIIVEQAMLLAGRTAGAWAESRNIPMIYLGTEPTADGIEILCSKLRRQIQTSHKRNKVIGRLSRLLAYPCYSPRPVYHSFLGYSSVGRVTSPLRRYVDLVTHWQIDAALREEHRTGASLVGQTDTSYLPTQMAEMERISLFCKAREINAKIYDRRHRKHWHIHAIARALYFNEAPMPDPLLCVAWEVNETVENIYKASAHQGKIQSLEAECFFNALEGEDGNTVKAGDLWEGRIDEIDIFTQKISFAPIRKVQDYSRRQAP